MKIDTLILGSYETNCYILSKDDNVVIIDPADNFSVIKNEIAGKNLLGIIITHHHFDHVGALEELKKYYNVNVYDINNLKEGANKLGD